MDQLYIEKLRQDELAKWKEELETEIQNAEKEIVKIKAEIERVRVRYSISEKASFRVNDYISNLLKEYHVKYYKDKLDNLNKNAEENVNLLNLKIQQLQRLLEEINRNL
jgi:septation ring formation regulator EzrA